MKTKRLYLLMLAALLSAIAAVAVSLSGGSHRADPLAGRPVLARIKSDPSAVAKVVLTGPKATITLNRAESGWTVGEKAGFPADPQKTRRLLLGLAEITYVEPKTALPALYSRLDLDDPGKDKSQSILVEADDAQGAVLGKLIVGKRRIDELGGGNDGVYLRMQGEAQSWLAKGTLDLDGDVLQWLDRRFVDLPDARIKQVTIQQPDGAKIVMAREKPEDKFALKDMPADRKLKSDTILVDPATALQAFDLTDVKRAQDLPFPKDGLVVATYETFDGLTVRVQLLKQGDAFWITLAAEGGSDEKVKAEAEGLNKRWSGWVYGAGSSKGAALATKLEDVLEPKAPPAPAPGTPAPPTPAPGQSPKP